MVTMPGCDRMPAERASRNSRSRSGALLGIVDAAQLDRLDGHRAADVGIDGVVHHSHGAAAQFPDDFVSPDTIHLARQARTPVLWCHRIRSHEQTAPVHMLASIRSFVGQWRSCGAESLCASPLSSYWRRPHPARSRRYRSLTPRSGDSGATGRRRGPPGYDLVFPRYGQPRHGVAVTIFVTETFSNTLRVKADPGKHPSSDRFPVMKLNLVEDFQTGIYDYNLMTSTFVALAPVNERPRRGR